LAPRLAPAAIALPALLLSLAAPACAQKAAPTVEAAEAALREGRYDEAIDLFRALARRPETAGPATKGLVRALAEVGRYDEAVEVAGAGAEASPELAATLGGVHMLRGDREAAERAFRRALEAGDGGGAGAWAAGRGGAAGSAGRDGAAAASPGAPGAAGATGGPGLSARLTAQLGLAELLDARGERDAARRLLESFIDVYNRSTPGALGAEGLLAVGSAVRLLGVDDPQLFKDALRAYDEAAAADPAAHEPRLLAGELFLEKYNSADARRSFEEVLAVNPRHPRALLGLARVMEFDGEPGAGDVARRALETNPNLVGARALLARLRLASDDPEGAAEEAERALAGDPTSLEALAALAGARRLAGDDAGFEAAVRRAAELYPRSAEPLASVAELSAQNRDYRGAVELARRALERDPRSWRAHGTLGINLLRLGRPDEARSSLETAFRGDPYNVWYKNTLDLLDRLGEFVERRSEHFVFVLHRDEAALLGPYVEALAEEAYAALAERYGTRPAGAIRVEVYPRHADFSVRTLGLVGLGALGVAFGDVLAMDSPAARGRGEFNWGSTLWHEIAHAFHLGVTGHRIPRWFAEGLAVREERRAREGWGADPDPGFLAALAAGRLAPVSRLSDGIVRPSYPEQVMHSYYQASLVVEMIEAEHGFEAIPAMLRAYARGAGSEAVFREVLGTEPEAFDARFDAWLRRRFAGALDGMRGADGVVARIERARSKLEAGDVAAAIAELEGAAAAFPDFAGPGSPWALLARIHAERGDLERAAEALARWTSIDENAYDARLELAALRERLGDRRGAAAALERAVWIHPYDPSLHERLAGLYEALGEAKAAVRARRAILALGPVDRAGAHYRLARALLAAGDRAEARREVLRALEIAPAFAEAQELLLELAGGQGGGR
jgi:tetratricopeptide (TPR) repeat protein